MSEIVGWVGCGLILIGYILNTSGKWSSNSKSYQLVNIGGSFILMIYSWIGESYPFVLLNAVWFTVGVISIFRAKK